MKFFKKSVAVLLTLAMVFGMVAASLSANAESTETLYVGGVQMADGDYLANGATSVQSTEPSGGYAYYENGKLTLNNYEFEGSGKASLWGDEIEYYSALHYISMTYDKLTIELIGHNFIKQTNDDPAVDSKSAIHSSTGLVFTGSGRLDVISTDCGVFGNDYITVSSDVGEINIEAARFGLESAFSKISSDSLGNNVFEGGDIIIGGGNVNISAGNPFYLYYGDIIINGGNIDAKCTYSGEDDECFVLDAHEGEIKIAERLKVRASTEPDGELVKYVAADNDTYDRVVIRDYEMSVGGVDMANGDYLANGATAVQSTEPSGGYAYFSDGVLTLNNYEFEGNGRPGYWAGSVVAYDGIYFAEADDSKITKITINLIGSNVIKQTNVEESIQNRYAVRIFGELELTGSGSLDVASTGKVIYAQNSITVNGGNITSKCTYSGDDDDCSAIRTSSGEIKFAENLVVKASTEPDGELVDYVAADNNTYDLIVITDHVCQGTPVEGKDATCEAEGWADYYECECGKCYLDENCEEEIADINEWKSGDGLIPALNHPETTDTVVTEATCSKEGVIETTCDICGDVIATTAIEKLPHAETIDVPTTKPTCTDAGIIETFCKECGEKTATKPVESTGHDEGIWKVDFEATAEHDGQMIRYCTKCNAVLETKTFEKHTHTEGYTKTIPATCTQDGEKATFCAECGTCYKTEVIEKTGHGETVETVSVKPTCTQAGENVKYCKDCGVAVETVVVEATDHAWSAYSTNANGSHSKTCYNCGVEEKENCTYTATTTASTCLESGYTKHECDVCGHSYIDSETQALGHKWSEWTDDENGTTHTRECTACGEKETHDHEWGEWTYNEDGTFTENGTKTRACAICGAEETDTAHHTSDICRFFYPIICFVGNIVHKVLYALTLDWLFPEITIKPEF